MENKDVKQTAQEAMDAQRQQGSNKQLYFWIAALIIGGILGMLGNGTINEMCDFVATIFTRLFQFIAVPTIALAVTTTLASLGAEKNTGKIFVRTITYTLLTTFAASFVALALYIIIAPGNLPSDLIGAAAGATKKYASLSYYNHFLNVVPNNMVRPFLEGNVLSVLSIAGAVGMGIACAPKNENREVVLKFVYGLQEVLFTMIRGLMKVLPIGIVAFAAQLSAQIEAGVIVGALGKYMAVVMGGNFIQMFIVLPLFLLARGLNPIDVFRKMSPALAVALFTKSSAATLPVTLASAEMNLKARKEVTRFVLPICTTINMNGCAAFILVTSLFVLQNGGVELTMGTMLTWVCISVFAAVGNAGVPMGCYFLTLSLVSSMGAPVGVMGIILPIYAVIDMIETAENVWSDSTVCAMTNNDLKDDLA
ncbi:dicarboxylate/amino acid:cation symporter [Phascolarctobacterium sp.]|uniref:dicarboxylate/amino acid:cation symporter n=1 Tax=Phascolarctobacterium sp. TaxID=2049039 RepID=UPI002A7EFD1F|nr:dicarboxylate/amino acid:cation symporter [Phascolarctobacterium sp.]MDY5045046.1 dicarboxylate/amino acid:cation symporter [Phascolarctobacterium sp.]